MSNHTDYKQEIDDWANMWDEMQDDGIHPAIEKPKPSAFASQVLGDAPADSYYDYLDGQEDLLSEEEIVTTQNPVRMDTVGADNKQPEPAWVREDLLDEIQKMKDRLFQMENELARMGQGKKHSEKPVETDDKKSMSKLESLRKQIDKLSDELGIENDPSPYKIKKK
jgi:hypothetical protein